MFALRWDGPGVGATVTGTLGDLPISARPSSGSEGRHGPGPNPPTMADWRDLPHPDSEEFKKLRLGSDARAIYRLLFDADEPMTMLEIRAQLRDVLGEQEQLDR